MLYMKLTNPFKTFLPIEILLLVLFIIYLVFPIKTPFFLNNIIESPIGLIIIFIITISFFLYSNPVLAILFLFVAYELLRRSSVLNINLIKQTKPYKNNENTPTLNDIDLKNKENGITLIQTNNHNSLEIEVVQKMSPIGKSEPAVFVETSFKPFSDNLKGLNCLTNYL